MSNWLRGKRRGLAGFLVITGLVAGGLGWVTSAALRLEQEQHDARLESQRAERLRVRQREQDQARQARRREQEQQEAQAQAEFAANLRLALWRLDSRIAPVLAREDTRPYNHYSPVFTPPIVLDPKGHRYEPVAVLEPSPLLSAELPDWMLLHFQTSPGSGWGSPQVLSAASLSQLTKNFVSSVNVTPTRKRLLAELASSATSLALLQGVRQQELQLAATAELEANLDSPLQLAGNHKDGKENKLQNWQQPVNPQQPLGQKLLPNGAQTPNQKLFPGQQEINPQLLTQQGQQRDFNYGYGGRAATRIQLNNDRKGETYADNAWAVMQNTTNSMLVPWPATSKPRPSTREQVLVRMGPMTPFWLVARPGHERLVAARRVRITTRWAEQLEVLNGWPRSGGPLVLALATLAQSKARGPHPREVCQGIVLDWPRLQKLLTDEVRDLFPEARLLPMHADTPPHPERTMTALPLELDPGSAPAPPPAPPEPPADPPDLAAGLVIELGWTPLRIGLALSWAAALVALAAVGLGGWSLLDLSERRIRFVSAVTHELRTPLTTLRLYLDMLTGGLVKDEERKAEYLSTLNGETDRLSRLVSNVLDFSRLENQRPRLVRERVGVDELLGQVAATWQSRCHDAEKELAVDNTAGPDAGLVTDVHLVQQILGNLIDNACKYSRGAEDRHIRLRARPAGPRRLVLEVEDRGPGVPQRERRAIFRAFCRGRSADVTAGGVGLGLALAQRWARLLGGTLTLCSPAEGGACFRLELPLEC